MLPSINTKDGTELSHNRVLVCVRLNLNGASLRILHEPGPSTALDTRQRRVEFLLQRIQTAIAVIDGLAQGAGWGLASALVRRRQVLPE